jgi:hypothetical protein
VRPASEPQNEPSADAKVASRRLAQTEDRQDLVPRTRTFNGIHHNPVFLSETNSATMWTGGVSLGEAVGTASARGGLAPSEGSAMDHGHATSMAGLHRPTIENLERFVVLINRT